MSQAPPAGVPVCYRHAGRETYVTCTRCGRAICPDCMRSASVGHQCPDCVAEGRRTQLPAHTPFGGSALGRHGYVTISLIAINVFMLLVSVLSAKNAGNALGGAGWGSSTPLMRDLGVVGSCGPYSCGISEGEYYRLFTAMFMHFGLLHLAMNMWALWILGRALESMLGPVRFLALYLVSGLGGNVAAYLFQSDALSAGASTALFGLFAALFLAMRRLGLSTSAVLPVIIINLVLTFTISGISIYGHLGGFLVGGLVGAGLVYAPRANRAAIQTAVLISMVLVLGGLSLWQTAQLTA